MTSYNEALSASLAYFNGDELAAEVFLGKYALTTPEGDILEPTPDYTHHRLAKEFARIEAKYPNPLTEEEIFDFLKDFKRGVAQGSPMAGIGNPYQLMSISNCFTISAPFDSYAGICLTDQEEAQIMKRRGGVGFDISTIRPSGAHTNNAAKTTDGISVFMERFSNTCREVAQGGRRGALMLTISIHHPDIETFIKIKKDLTKVTGANISIRLTDEFLRAVEENKDYQQKWPINSNKPSIVKKINAKYVWDQIIESAHQSAEPGLLFWDTIQRETPTECYEEYKATSTNPCSEIILSDYDSCRLFLINTVGYVQNPFEKDAKFNWEKFNSDIQMGQRLMDDTVDLELECIEKIQKKIEIDPEPAETKQIEKNLWCKIKNACMRGRRTGLGLTAIGDTLAALNIRYGSQDSIDIVEDIYKQLALNSYRSTVMLAEERGPFSAYDYNLEKDHQFINKIMNLDPELRKNWERFGRRNIALTTTAPAGSVSVLTQTTSGIEPAYEIIYKRRKKINPNDLAARIDYTDSMGDKWQEYVIYHHWFKKWIAITGDEKIEHSPYHQALAMNIDWLSSVKLQAAAQKWICHSISKTCNLPSDVSKETIANVYMAAWKAGNKGFTVYRDGCRSGVLIKNESKPEEEVKFEIHNAPRRSKELLCDIHNMTVIKEKWTFFVGLMDNRPYEIMGGLSKYVSIPKRVKEGKIIKHNGAENPVARYDLHYDYEKGPDEETIIRDITNAFENATHAAFTRTISLALRHGTPVQYVVEQITKGSEKEDDLYSFSKAVGRVLKQYLVNGTKVSGNKCCPECKNTDMRYQEGCITCSCGWSKCS